MNSVLKELLRKNESEEENVLEERPSQCKQLLPEVMNLPSSRVTRNSPAEKRGLFDRTWQRSLPR